MASTCNGKEEQDLREEALWLLRLGQGKEEQSGSGRVGGTGLIGKRRNRGGMATGEGGDAEGIRGAGEGIDNDISSLTTTGGMVGMDDGEEGSDLINGVVEGSKGGGDTFAVAGRVVAEGGVMTKLAGVKIGCSLSIAFEAFLTATNATNDYINGCVKALQLAGMLLNFPSVEEFAQRSFSLARKAADVFKMEAGGGAVVGLSSQRLIDRAAEKLFRYVRFSQRSFIQYVKFVEKKGRISGTTIQEWVEFNREHGGLKTEMKECYTSKHSMERVTEQLSDFLEGFEPGDDFEMLCSAVDGDEDVATDLQRALNASRETERERKRECVRGRKDDSAGYREKPIGGSLQKSLALVAVRHVVENRRCERKKRGRSREKELRRVVKKKAKVTNVASQREVAALCEDVGGCKEELRRKVLFDTTILYRGDIDLRFIIEQAKDGSLSGDVMADGEYYVPKGSEGYLHQVYFLNCTNLQFYILKDAKHSFHGHVEEHDAVEIRKRCEEVGIPYVCIRGGRNYCVSTNAFLKVVNGGSPLFEKLFPVSELEWDPVALTKRMLVDFGRKEEGVMKRGALHFDGGFANHSYDHLNPCSDSVMASPVIINKSDDDQFYYDAAGPLIAMIDRAVKELKGEEKIRPYGNWHRQRQYGDRLAVKCGIEPGTISAEAFTLVLTKVGDTNDDGAMMNGTAEYVLSRHRDRLNCSRPGYDNVGCMSCVFVWGCIVYRLALVTYSRESCGRVDEKAHQYAMPLLEECLKFRQNNVGYEEDLIVLDNEYDIMEKPRNSDPSKEGSLKLPVCSRLANADRLAYLSSFIHAMAVMKQVFDLSGELQRQLLYIALLSNSQFIFYYVIMRWTNCGNKYILIEGLKRPVLRSGVNLVVEYYRDCRRLGLKQPVELGYGNGRRCTPFCATWPGICDLEREDKSWESGEEWRADSPQAVLQEANALAELGKSLANLKCVIDAGNNTNATSECLFQQATRSHKEGGVKYLGQFSGQALFPLAVLSGMLKKPEHALYCKIGKGTAAYKYFERLGVKETEMQSALKALSKNLDTEERITENMLCEIKRKSRAVDLFFKGQKLYKCSQVEDGEWRVYQRELSGKTWEVVNNSAS